MARRTTKKTKRPAGVGLDAYVGKQLADLEFRHHLEQRRLVHEVAIVVRSMREQAGLTQAQLAKMVGVSQPMDDRADGARPRPANLPLGDAPEDRPGAREVLATHAWTAPLRP